MISRIKSKRIVTPSGYFDGYVYFDQEKIICITTDDLPFDEQYDFSDNIVSPGFIDMHVHGGSGIDFSSASIEQVAAATDFHLKHGTTTIVPTITTVPFDTMYKALENIQQCKNAGQSRANIAGVHLEGPYFSPLQCGAQNPETIRTPIPEEYDTLLSKFGNLILRWSYAPELDQDLAFSKALQKAGVVASIGHSNAIYDECMAAYTYGCKLVTHLYSATSTITRVGGYRRLGVIETAFLLDDMDVEIIADGKHMPPELIRMICKIKGYDRVSLITDAILMAGTNQTRCNGSVPFIIEDGVAKLLDRSAFAGSIATTDRLIKVCVNDAGVPLLDAIKMLTENPARLMHINAGQIAPARRPDFVVLGDDISVKAVFVNGKPID